MNEKSIRPTPAVSRKRRSGFFTWKLLLVALPIVVMVVIGFVGPLFLPYDFRDGSIIDRLLPPGGITSDGATVLLGTDGNGRDLLPQIIAGARVSITVGLASSLAGGILGAVLGMIAGYFGGWVDSIIMRLADIQMTMPAIVFAILLAAVLGPSTFNVIVVITLAFWAKFARVARGSTLAAKEQEYVAASRAMGGKHLNILWFHILPNVRTPMLILGTLEFGLAILLESSLSFLGLGSPPADPSWGLTISNGRNYLDSAWWISTLPGFALAALVVSVGLVGDKLRDHLDPNMLRGLKLAKRTVRGKELK